MKRSTRLNRRTRLRSNTALRRLTGLHANRPRRMRPRLREQIRRRADGWCEARIVGVCARVGSHAHHRLMRSQGGQDTPENLLWTCPPCHRYIHDHPAESYETGRLLRRTPVSAPCPMSGRSPASMRIVRDGQVGCECCGRMVDVLAEPTGWGGAVLADHDREVF